MKSKRITFNELCDIMYAHNKKPYQGLPLNAVIVFKKESFVKDYPEESRSYAVCSESKYFNPKMGGNSLIGSSLDGTDVGVRLDWYLHDEKPWKVEYCYLTNDWQFKTSEELVAEAKEAAEALIDCLDAIALSNEDTNARDSISQRIYTLFQSYVGRE